MGGGENEEMHEVLNDLQAAWKGAWHLSPHLKTFCNFHCIQKQTFNENYKWYSGHCFRVGEAWTTHRLGVIAFRSAFRRLIGVNSSQWEKIIHWKCVGKWHGWRLSVTEQWVGKWNGALLAVCAWIYLCEDYSREALWNDWVDLWSGMKKALMPCGAEVGKMNWTNVVKGGRVVRHEQRPPKRNEWREWTDRKHMAIKFDLFSPTATTDGWWGNLEVFGQRSGAKALILCGYYT
jgi:hypothetical protein